MISSGDHPRGAHMEQPPSGWKRQIHKQHSNYPLGFSCPWGPHVTQCLYQLNSINPRVPLLLSFAPLVLELDPPIPGSEGSSKSKVKLIPIKSENGSFYLCQTHSLHQVVWGPGDVGFAPKLCSAILGQLDSFLFPIGLLVQCKDMRK